MDKPVRSCRAEIGCFYFWFGTFDLSTLYRGTPGPCRPEPSYSLGSGHRMAASCLYASELGGALCQGGLSRARSQVVKKVSFVNRLIENLEKIEQSSSGIREGISNQSALLNNKFDEVIEGLNN